jgi:hypothetical protein
MRWFITINGETHGPVDESVIRSWIRQKQVPPGSMVAPEGPNSTWVPVERSSFAHKPAPMWLAFPIGAGLLVAMCAVCKKDEPIATTPPGDSAAATKPVERVQRTCILSIPGDRDSVLLFPTEEGFDEFGKAAASGDDEAMEVTRRANAGFFVDSGTKCTWLNRGLLQTKVRVVAGPHAGKAGYVPTEWASGR